MDFKNIHIVQKALRKGDSLFFQKMYANYYEPLCIYSMNYGSNRIEAEDIVQETFLYIWSNRKKIIISTSLNSYLYRVVYNKRMDTFRQKKHKDEKLMAYYNEALNRVISTDESYKEERLNQLEKCMEELPKRCRKAFYDKKIEGLLTKQIAKNMDISIKTVEGHITRAFKLLKVCLYDLSKVESI